MTEMPKNELFPRLSAYRKPLRASRMALWVGLFGYLILLNVLAEEGVLPEFSFQSSLWWIVMVSVLVATAGMVWVGANGLKGVLYGPQREYRAVLDQLPVDSLRKIAEHYPELSEIERGILRQTLNRRCPGWSENASADVRSALS